MDENSNNLCCSITLKEIRGEIGEWNNSKWIKEQQDPYTLILETEGPIQKYEYKHRYESLDDIADKV